MKKVVVHIGVEKTGTTTIQSFMSNNRIALAKHGFLYPTAPGDQNHVGLAILAADRPDMIYGLFSFLGLPPDIDVDSYTRQMLIELQKEAATSECHTLVLSNEHLSSRLQSEVSLENLKRCLSHFADVIDVVIYLRRQDEAVLSEYSTLVKTGHTKGFTLKGSHMKKFDYAALLDRWSAVFGKDRIKVRMFEPGAFEGGDLVSDLLSAIGCAQRPEFSAVSPQNVSLDAPCLEYLRRLNRHISAKDRRYLVDDLSQISTREKPQFSTAEADEILHQFEDSNRDVARRYLGRQDGRLFMTLPARSVENNLTRLDDELTFKITADLWRSMGRVGDNRSHPGAVPSATHQSDDPTAQD
jgi:hypothetical protein